jgi:hypothetical protein
MSPQTKTIDKVLKLLAKAESTTEAEAEALVAKAHHLMVQAEIDEAMLAAARGDRTDDEIIEKSIMFKGSYAEAQRQLFFAIGDASGFKNIQFNQSAVRRRGTWIGFRSDLERTEVLLTSLLIQQQRAATTYAKDNVPDYATGREKFLAKRSHMIGFARGVKERMRKERQAATKAAAAARPEAPTVGTESSSVELVLLSKRQRVDGWYDEKYGHLKSARATSMVGSWSAGDAGHAAGKNADVGATRVGGPRGSIGSGR